MRLSLKNIKVFSKEWFCFWQPLLLLAVNFPVKGIREDIRHRLRIDQDNLPLDMPIVELMPHAYTVMTGFGKYQTTFRTHAKYAKRLFYEWKYIWDLVHRWDVGFANKFIPALNLGFDTLIAYPDADPETSTVDGAAVRYVGSSPESITTLLDSTGNDAQVSNAQTGAGMIQASSTTDLFVSCYRGVYLFDTSSIGVGTSISSAIMSIYTASHWNAEDSYLRIVSSNPASNTDLVNSDYEKAKFGTTDYGSILVSSLTNSQYNDWTLNASGIAAISLTSISKFGIRIALDIDQNPTWASNRLWGMSAMFADQTGTEQDPKLTVEYTLPVTSTPLHHGKPGLQTSGKAHGRKGL